MFQLAAAAVALVAVEQRLAEHLPRSEEVPAADQPLAERLQSSADVLPLEMMPVDRAAERLPVQTTLPLQLVLARPAERLALQPTTLPLDLLVARPAERLALQARVQLFPVETPEWSLERPNLTFELFDWYILRTALMAEDGGSHNCTRCILPSRSKVAPACKAFVYGAERLVGKWNGQIARMCTCGREPKTVTMSIECDREIFIKYQSC